MAALLNKRARTTVQEVSVDEIMQCFQAFLAAKKDRDLTALLERALQVSWKSAPSTALPAFVEGYELFANVLQRCGPVLSNQKTLLALVSLHDDKPCNFTRQPMRAWADLVSASVRACLAKLRECAYDPTLQERTLRKATVQQASALQGLAAMVRRWDDKGPTSSALPLALAAQVLAPAAGADAATALGDDGWPDFMAMLGRPSAKPRSASKALQAALSVEPVTYEQKLQGKDADDREPASPDKDAQARTQPPPRTSRPAKKPAAKQQAATSSAPGKKQLKMTGKCIASRAYAKALKTGGKEAARAAHAQALEECRAKGIPFD
ncbi:unnamed protein product [Effrenium voratum]|nr:unnamed protein product [Effrenium voratum]